MRLRGDLAAITAAALEAVRPESLVVGRLAVVAGELLLDGVPLPRPLDIPRGRIVVVGGGKAAAGMATGLVEMLAAGGVAARGIAGLVSVPEGCGRTVAGVEVRETRPAAENVPTPAAEAATREMLDLVSTLRPDDLAVALVSGGGSALLTAPRAGVPLEEKVAVIRFLSAAGVGITELNRVRRGASEVKGGGLARACGAGRMLVLVISDVIGDPLETIASGPCLPGAPEAAAGLAVLERYGATAVAPRLTTLLREEATRPGGSPPPPPSPAGSWTTPRGCRVDHIILGDNAAAVAAAAGKATRLGYQVTVRPAVAGPAETADEVGRRLACEGLALVAADGRPRAVIEGGEAVVRLPADHGTGGRNQQTVAAALAVVLGTERGWPPGLLLASLGTDGEDGPTGAAGGLADSQVAARVVELGLDPVAAAARCDSLPLLEAAGGLVVTGPSGTNVADLRIVLARR